MSPTISAICRFPNFEGSPGGLDGGTKSMKSNRGMPYDALEPLIAFPPSG